MQSLVYRMKDDIILYHGDHYSLSFDDEKQVYGLKISGAFTEDSGTYICLAKNPSGTSTSSFKLKISGKFSFKIEFLQKYRTLNYRE